MSLAPDLGCLFVNASPLIFLGNADRLPILRDVCRGRVAVPEAVFKEVVESQHADRAAKDVRASTWLE